MKRATSEVAIYSADGPYIARHPESGFDAGFGAGFGAMAITSAEFVKWDGSFRTYGGSSATLYYVAFGDDPEQNFLDILDDMVELGTPAFPTPWAVWDGDSSSRAQEFRVTQNRDERGSGGSGIMFNIAVSFGPMQSNVAGGGFPQPRIYNNSPLLWSTPVRIERVPINVPVIWARNIHEFRALDATGPVVRNKNQLGPITNTVKDTVETDFEIEITMRQVVIVKNFASIEKVNSFSTTYENTVNTKRFYGRPPGFARFLSIVAGERQEFRGTPYYPCTIRIALDPNDYPRGFISVPNQGLNEWGLNAAGRLVPVPIRRDNNRVTSPVDLTRFGLALPPDGLPNTVTYNYLRPIDYSKMGINE
jgi:hypothetical protein